MVPSNHKESEVYLDTDAQVAYLAARGIRLKKRSINNMRVAGTAPKFRYFGNKPVSTPAWMDEWIESRLSPVMRSTSEAPHLAKAS